jgi:hypothetical protein
MEQKLRNGFFILSASSNEFPARFGHKIAHKPTSNCSHQIEIAHISCHKVPTSD